MRKSLILFFLLLALSISGVFIAHNELNKAGNQVTIKETIIRGKKAAAENVTLNFNATCGNNLSWSTFYTVGEEPVVQTAYSFSKAQEDEEVWASDIITTENGSKLMLLSEENGEFWLTILDAKSSKELQRLQITEHTSEDCLWRIFYFEDFFVPFMYNDHFSVFAENSQGEYEEVFTANASEASALGEPMTGRAKMCWDGKKLAILDLPSSAVFLPYECVYYLSVYDESGLLYLGRYDSSLNLNIDIDYYLRCHPDYAAPISVSW